MKENQQDLLVIYQAEIDGLIKEINIDEDGEHLWSNYQKITAITIRLAEIHNEIAYLEIQGTDWPELKKLRTLILDPTIERLERVAAFESRKLTAMQLEMNLSKE